MNNKNTALPLILGAGGLLLVVMAAILLTRKEPTPEAAIEVQGAPALRVNQERIDFGDVKLGTTVQASFTITNAGSQALRLSEPPYIEVKEGR